MVRPLSGISFTLAAAMVMSGCSPEAADSEGPSFTAELGRSVLPDSEVRAFLEELPRRSLSTATATRLAPDLVPPTNRWFSGLVFGAEPVPVHPIPLWFRLDDAGFTFGVPSVDAQSGTVGEDTAEHVSVVTAATSVLVTRYDEVSVTMTLLRSPEGVDRERGEAFAEVTVARGSLIVSYRALVTHTLSTSVAIVPVDGVDGVWSLTAGEGDYGLVSARAALAGDDRTLRLPAGAHANWVAVPEGAALTDVASYAASPLVGVQVRYRVEGEIAVTSIRYLTEDGSSTLVGRLPHHSAFSATTATTLDCVLGSAETVYGQLSVCGASEVTFAAPAVTTGSAAELAGFDVSALDDVGRGELVDSLRTAAARVPDPAADTLVGGSVLAQMAMLLSLARDLEQPEVVDELQARLLAELRTWIDPSGCEVRDHRCFVYDPELRGIVGLVPASGSEHFTGHHRHYGSFLLAAAVVAEGDRALVAELRPMMSLLAADIASSGGDLFPTRRAFDPYTGRSQDSGPLPSVSGDPHGALSQAIDSHHALTLWGAVSGDTDLEMEGRWMLALESLAAEDYGTNGESEVAARDRAAWFDADHQLASLMVQR